MKKIAIIMLAIMIAVPCYAKTFKVVTGFGYFKDKSGDVMAKTRLTPGTYPLDNNDLEYVEVPNSQALNAIEIYSDVDEEQDANNKAARREQFLSDLDLTEADLVKIKELP